jgi:hypothetical protein
MRDEDAWLESRTRRLIRNVTVDIGATYESFSRKHGIEPAATRAFMNNRRKLGASIATLNRMLAPFRMKLAIVAKEPWED